MAISLHTISTETGGGNGRAVAGTVIGVALYPDGTVFDNQLFADLGRAVVELPSDYTGDGAEFLGAYLTSLGEGFHDGTTFADTAALLADATLVPEKYKNVSGESLIFFNGYNYVTYETNGGLGEPLSLTITSAGLGYTIGTGISTVTTSGEGASMTIEVTSVGGNGEITGVAITDAGAGYEVNDTVQVLAGDGSAILTVGSLVEPKIGELNTGRGASNQASANDINPSYFTATPNGIPESDLELYIPSSGQILFYDTSLPAPYKFDSLGDCFTGGDFRVHVRRAGSTEVIAEVICPGPQDVNSDIDLTPYS